MIHFDDLKFDLHPVHGLKGKIARHFFPNGYGVSVIGGDKETGLYGNGVNTFELAVIKGSEKHWDICYDTPITNDVLGWNSKDEITELMQKVAALQ